MQLLLRLPGEHYLTEFHASDPWARGIRSLLIYSLLFLGFPFMSKIEYAHAVGRPAHCVEGTLSVESRNMSVV